MGATLFPKKDPSTASTDASVFAKFRCGKMRHTPVDGEPGKFRVVADPRRGYLICKRDEFGVKRVKWVTRDDLYCGMLDDHMVFPGEQTFTQVDTGNKDDRVYLLQYTAKKSQRFFFWMQEPLASADEANVKKVQDAIGVEKPLITAESLEAALRNTSSFLDESKNS